MDDPPDIDVAEHWPALGLHPGAAVSASGGPSGGPGAVSSVSGGFSGAAVWRISGSGTPGFCLRRWPADADPDRLRGIHSLLNHIADCGMTVVPVPLPDGSGASLVRHAGRWWQLEPWMPGTADFMDHPVDARLDSAMRGLAQWHIAAARFDPSAAEARWLSHSPSSPSPAITDRISLIDDGTRRLPAIEQALVQEPHVRFRELGMRITLLFRRSSRTVRESLVAATGIRVPLQPCLRDVWHDHLLFTGNELTGLIDFGAVRTETVASDLSRLLGSLLHDDHLRWQQALEAYTAVRPLSEAEQRLVPLLDQSGVLLSGLTWLKRRCLLNTPLPDLDRVCGRLARNVERLHRLAGGW